MLNKKNVALLLPLATTAYFCSACEEDIILTTCNGYGSVATSTVCDESSHTLVNGVSTVTFVPKKKNSCYSTVTVKTDNSGRFAIKKIMAGDYTVTFTNNESNLSYTQDVTIPETIKNDGEKGADNADGGSENVENIAVDTASCDTGDDFKITNTCEGYYRCIPGRFCDQRTGLWVAGGEISVKETNTTTISHTDSNGNGVIRVKNGPHTIEINNKDYHKTYDIEVTENFSETIGETVCEAVGHGNVEGNICAFLDDSSTDNSGYYLYGANVFVEMGNFYQSTTTDADGHFLLRGIPEGAAIKVQAQKGRYTTTFDAQIDPEQTTTISQPQCVDTSKVKIGIVANLNDKWGFVVESLHFSEYVTYTTDTGWGSVPVNPLGNITYIGKNGISCFDGSDDNCGDSMQHFFIEKLLMVSDRLNEFDVLYFSSGNYDRVAGSDKVIFENISKYLQKGGSIFVSDNGYELLRSYFKFLGKNYIDWLGDENKGGSANQGYNVGEYKVKIVDKDAMAALHEIIDDNGEINANFAQNKWSVMESNQPNATILVKGTAPINGGSSSVNDAAMVVSVTPFENGGKIIFSSIASNKSPSKVAGDTMKLFQYLFYEL